MKSTISKFWLVCLVLCLGLGNVLANVHIVDHLGHSHLHHATPFSGSSWLNEALHAEDESGEECPLYAFLTASLLTPESTPSVADYCSLGVLGQSISRNAASVERLLPPSRAPPSFS